MDYLADALFIVGGTIGAIVIPYELWRKRDSIRRVLCEPDTVSHFEVHHTPGKERA
jgi:hypothetical protein